jgi:hypothetical protein
MWEGMLDPVGANLKPTFFANIDVFNFLNSRSCSTFERDHNVLVWGRNQSNSKMLSRKF